VVEREDWDMRVYGRWEEQTAPTSHRMRSLCILSAITSVNVRRSGRRLRSSEFSGPKPLWLISKHPEASTTYLDHD
jgi:hypothetical protein